MVLPVVAASNVTVPELWVNVPGLDHEPPIRNAAESDAWNVAPEFIVTSLSASSFLSLVFISTVSAVPELESVRSFFTVVEPVPVPLKVIVGLPELAVKVRL